MYRFLTALAFAVLVTVPATAAEHTKDSLEVVRERVREEKAVLIDVREEAEWKAGHLERAKLVPLSRMKTKKGLEEVLAELPKDTPIYLHCRSGGRCLIVGEMFEKAGLDARPLKAGYADLVKAGFEKAEESDE